MTERYVLPAQLVAEREFNPTTAWWNFAPKFNVAPEQYVPAIRWHDGATEGVMMRWGFIPSWAEGKQARIPSTNVDVRRLAKSKKYQGPWLSSQRCILPVGGFYVWQMTEARYRQPYFVRLTNRAVFGLAAVWDRSVSEEDDVIESCAILAVPANELMAGIVTDEESMPAILRRKDYQTYLQGTPVEARDVLAPYRKEWMEAYPVSPRVNSAAADDASLIRPLS